MRCHRLSFAALYRIEATALVYGVSEVVTVEYNQLTYEHPNMTTVTPQQLFEPTESYGV